MKKNILIVDDEEDIRDVLRDVLEAQYSVSEATSGTGLKKALANDAPDVILLDLNLGDADGMDLLPLIKKKWPEAQVIVLTATTKVEAAVEATKRGAFHFITKPFEFGNLQVTLQRALEHQGLRAEASALRDALSFGGGAADAIPAGRAGSTRTARGKKRPVAEGFFVVCGSLLPDTPGANARLLIVDDKQAIRELIGDYQKIFSRFVKGRQQKRKT